MPVLSGARRAVLTVLGLLVLGTGLALTVLPGPGLVVIVIGLRILAGQYAWARRLLDRARAHADRAARAAVYNPLRTAFTALGTAVLVLLGAYLVITGPELPGPLRPGALGWALLLSGIAAAALTGYAAVDARRRISR